MTKPFTTGKNFALKELLSASSIRLARGIGVHDALGGRIAERFGFEFLWLSGLEVSTAFGLPDASLITMTELLQVASIVVRSTKLPLLADCDTGFGGVINVRRLISECERIGVSGVCLEDKKFPKANSFYDTPQTLESAELSAEKIAVAVGVRNDPNFVVVARTESFIAGESVSEAIRRVRLYLDAGADAIFVHSRAKAMNELVAFFSEFGKLAPVILSPTTYWQATEPELRALGAVAVLYSNVGMRLAAKAMIDGVGILSENGSLAAVEPFMIPLAELQVLQEVTSWLP